MKTNFSTPHEIQMLSETWVQHVLGRRIYIYSIPFLAMTNQLHFNLPLFLKHKLWPLQSDASSKKFVMFMFHYTERRKCYINIKFISKRNRNCFMVVVCRFVGSHVTMPLRVSPPQKTTKCYTPCRHTEFLKNEHNVFKNACKLTTWFTSVTTRWDTVQKLVNINHKD